MVVVFTEKFNKDKAGRSKDLPDHIAKALIKSGEAIEAEKEVKHTKKAK